MKKTKIYLGWMSTGQSETMHLYLKRDLEERYGDRVEFVLPDLCVHRMFHDMARNGVVEEFLASDCDILWFLDSDIVPPTHILDLVVHHQDKWQVAGAAYPIYMQVPGTDEMGIVFTSYKGILKQGDGRGIVMADIPQEGQEFVDALATGCLFVKREVFSKLEKPYFEFKFDKESRRIIEGEDLGFALKLHDLGIQFFTDYGMVCKHLKRVCLLDMNNYAIQVSNQKTLQYDALIRSQVEAGTKAAYAAGYRRAKEEAVTAPKTKSGLILPNQFAR